MNTPPKEQLSQSRFHIKNANWEWTSFYNHLFFRLEVIPQQSQSSFHKWTSFLYSFNKNWCYSSPPPIQERERGNACLSNLFNLPIVRSNSTYIAYAPGSTMFKGSNIQYGIVYINVRVHRFIVIILYSLNIE